MKSFKELSFSEYYTSKVRLLETLNGRTMVNTVYEIKSYRKIPVSESLDDSSKMYINFKPKDRLTIVWEYENVHYPNVRECIVENEDGSTKVYYPLWNNKKMLSWVNVHARELDVNVLP